MAFDLPEIDDPGTVTAGATEIRDAGESVEQKVNDTADTWQPMSGQYYAPEAAQVHQAMKTPERMATELKNAADDIAVRLEDYASALGRLRRRKTNLEADISIYEMARAAANLSDPAVQAYFESWRLDLERQCAQLTADAKLADSNCARSLSVKTENADENIGQMLLNAAIRGNDLEGAAGPLLQGARLSTDAYKYYSMAFFYRNGNIRVRQGWAPKLLQDLAGKGKFGEGLVKSVTGWDASAVTNRGQFLATNSAMNPMAKPTTATGALQAVVGRSMLKLEGKNSRVPHAHQHGLTKEKWDKVGKASKLASRTGTGVAAVTNSMDSWQTDSQQRPNMGNWEKGARAGVTAAGATAGGWAGGKAGAATGAAVGSLFGPAGTVVGGVAGSIIGGFAGSSAGGWAANKVKDPVGGLFD